MLGYCRTHLACTRHGKPLYTCMLLAISNLVWPSLRCLIADLQDECSHHWSLWDRDLGKSFAWSSWTALSAPDSTKRQLQARLETGQSGSRSPEHWLKNVSIPRASHSHKLLPQGRMARCLWKLERPWNGRKRYLCIHYHISEINPRQTFARKLRQPPDDGHRLSNAAYLHWNDQIRAWYSTCQLMDFPLWMYA